MPYVIGETPQPALSNAEPRMSHVRQAAKAIAEHLRLAEQRRKQVEAKAAAKASAAAAASKPQGGANAKLQGTQPASSAPSERAAEAEPARAEDAEAERLSDRNPTEELMERLRGDGVEGCRAELLQLLTSPGATLLPPSEEPRRSQDDDEPAEPPPPPPPPPPPQPPPPQPPPPQPPSTYRIVSLLGLFPAVLLKAIGPSMYRKPVSSAPCAAAASTSTRCENREFGQQHMRPGSIATRNSRPVTSSLRTSALPG